MKDASQAKEKPPVRLTGQNGNAFFILGLCHRAAQKAKWTDEEWQVVRDGMMAGDYDNLLATAMQHFDVT